MLKKSFVVLFLSILLLLGLWTPHAASVETPPVKQYLTTGQFAAGEAAMVARLKQAPDDDQAPRPIWNCVS